LTRECDDEGCDGLAVDTAVENDGADYDGAGGCCAAAAAVGVAVVVELADDVDVVLTDTVGSDLGDDVDEKEVHGMVAADGCTVPAPVAEERTETGSKMHAYPAPGRDDHRGCRASIPYVGQRHQHGVAGGDGGGEVKLDGLARTKVTYLAHHRALLGPGRQKGNDQKWNMHCTDCARTNSRIAMSMRRIGSGRTGLVRPMLVSKAFFEDGEDGEDGEEGTNDCCCFWMKKRWKRGKERNWFGSKEDRSMDLTWWDDWAGGCSRYEWKEGRREMKMWKTEER